MDDYGRKMIGPLTIDKSSGSYVDARAYGITGAQAAIVAAIAGGTTAVAIGITSGALQTVMTIPASGVTSVIIDPGEIIALTYTSAPTWQWVGN